MIETRTSGATGPPRRISLRDRILVAPDATDGGLGR